MATRKKPKPVEDPILRAYQDLIEAAEALSKTMGEIIATLRDDDD